METSRIICILPLAGIAVYTLRIDTIGVCLTSNKIYSVRGQNVIRLEFSVTMINLEEIPNNEMPTYKYSALCYF